MALLLIKPVPLVNGEATAKPALVFLRRLLYKPFMDSVSVIILAAGNSTRLKSARSKVLHPIAGQPMIDYVLKSARQLKPKSIALVLGHDRASITAHLKDQAKLYFAHQKERRGTAHAAQVGLRALQKAKACGDWVLILNGDVPFLQAATLKQLLKKTASHPLGILSAYLNDPSGYGRIVRGVNGEISAIVEEKNASAQQRSIHEINPGVYLAKQDWLIPALKKIKPNPVNGELYITDLIALAKAEDVGVASHEVDRPEEILGANTREDLAYLNLLKREELAAKHLNAGVGMQAPENVFVDEGVKIGADTFLETGVQLLGNTKVGKGCHIEAGCILKDTSLADGVVLKAYSYLESCRVEQDATIGPFARVRPQSVIGKAAKVGNFVELKKTKLGAGSKASHLSYLGDTLVGQDANIGAGTITCNYDGKNKYQTTIGERVFVGSDTQLVAPVKLGKDAYVGAGTTVTKNVPAGHLVTSRTPQKNRKRK